MGLWIAETARSVTWERFLIANADDFGQSPGTNGGIITAHERGIVTSASLMVRGASATEAAAYGRVRPALSVGLHVDLGEWTYQGGAWVPVYEVVRLGDADAIAREVSRQLARFRSLMGRDPTHIDSHQHVHLREPVRSVMSNIAAEVGVPLRHCTPAIRYCGDFYGQTAEGSPLPGRISVDWLISILTALPPGFMELGCHPGEGNDLATMYLAERTQEVAVLCDPQVRAALADMRIGLRSFNQISGGWMGSSR